MARTSSTETSGGTDNPPTTAPTRRKVGIDLGDADSVYYEGPCGMRRITKEDWEGAGVVGQETVVWTRNSDDTFGHLPLELFTETALVVLARDSNFRFRNSETEPE